jgi:hypothetical protein
MRILKENTVGLFIDIQERLFPHMQEKEQLEHNLIRLCAGLKILEIPLLLTEQYTKGLGKTISPLRVALGEIESTEKMTFSCMDEPLFKKALISTAKKYVIMSGIETHVCILQTAIDLIHEGFQPVIIEDCVSSRKNADKQTALKRMRQEGALISSLESVLFELLRESGTDTFKAISGLVK